MEQRETALNDTARRIMVQENYDPHYAVFEQRILMETRLFLARWDALCKHLGVNPSTLLPVAQPRWRNGSRGIEYTEIARGEYLTTAPARCGEILVVFRDSQGHTWVRVASEMEDGRYQRL